MKATSREQSDLRRLFHDINGEIFLIRGNADLALIGVPGDSKARQQLQDIINHTEKLGIYLRQVQDLYSSKDAIPAERTI
ncbi:hypothetical protein H5P28_08550 [Ruficoccus amylovorans]|uniref:Uncharacterized protein n=1 Tax=Ruficoccus amylovorans TaxID=1804625 RepID=A0A842HDL8_9BACT|nr:hypothetical protein [Ruficoccus amylovorans]MBC2594310.1 hypothetical protein [Ruficoccus amylovorans]